jgi:hypothetical protein
MNNSTPQSRYPIRRWLTDLRWVFAQAARLSVPDRHRLFSDYYTAAYPADPHSLENRRRLLACADYLWRHLQEFAVEHLLEQDGDSCWISPHLEDALYRLFVGVQMGLLDTDFRISRVLDLADEQQRVYPSGEDE